MGLESEKIGERKMMRLRENESDIKKRRDQVRSHCQWWWCRDLWLHLSNQNAKRERERERGCFDLGFGDSKCFLLVQY